MTADEIAAQVERYAPLRVLWDRYKVLGLNVVKWELHSKDFAQIFPGAADRREAEYFGGIRVEPSNYVLDVGKVRILIEEPLGG